MASIRVLLGVLSFSSAVLVQGGTVSKPDSCEARLSSDEQSWNWMEVLPGIGWDNLRNKDMGLVFEYEYTQCQVTNDRKFLLPDGVFAIPVQQSDVQTYSELITHWVNHSSLTSSSINVEGHTFFASLGGKFSKEYTQVKETMYNQKSIIARVQIRHKLYVIRLQSGTKLNSMFKKRLLDIASHIINNNPDIARYLSELLIRDYGTHYLSAVHAGAILVQEDYLNSELAKESEDTMHKITASASANFFGKIGFSASYIHVTDTNFSELYLNNRTYSHVQTYGGPPYRVNFTINDWEDGLADTLVAIDREGVPLHFAIIPEVLTELPPTQTLELAHYVEKAIYSYYKHNTVKGCTNPDALNFNFAANVDDKSCHAPADNFTFGGVYQTCDHTPVDKNDIICPHLVQKNPLTGDYSCPLGYESVLLHTGTKSGSYSTPHCEDKCHHFIVKYNCHSECYNVNNPVTGNYNLYWCVATGLIHKNSGYMFGGLYSSTAINPLTQTASCPNYFYPLRFGEDTHVCVSDDYELGYALSVPFAGFDSCMAGNPLATKSSSGGLRMRFGLLEVDPNTWPHQCPTGYTQHLASMEQSCEINYCVKAGTLGEKGLPPIKLPPYRKYPNTNQDAYNVVSIMSSTGDLWKKNNSTNEWRIAKTAEMEDIYVPMSNTSQSSQIINASILTSATPIQSKDNNVDDSSNSPTTVALIISSTALLGLVIVVAVYGLYRCKGGKKTRKHVGSYENLDQTAAASTVNVQMEPTADV
ncbi:macrophage-expressed gene 1 protein-like [Dysidea avara]|uniref:macrophage-expressed gene 1 protein-like n=1 Tax=Dysidea avara TaxID=196820 RepID=UPI0033170B16